jgi:hypothetical protein
MDVALAPLSLRTYELSADSQGPPSDFSDSRFVVELALSYDEEAVKTRLADRLRSAP